MRTIKFKIWKKPDKEKGFDGKMHFLDPKKDGEINSFLIYCFQKPDEYEILQFTGLKDKNGKEIYEGDIVRFYFTEALGGSSDNKNGEHTEMIDVVKFLEGAFFFVNEDVGNGTYARRWNNICEVISNIYENKNLLF